MNPDCPPDDLLLAVATGEPGSDVVREHVEHCADCQMRVKLLRGEIAELRSLSAPVVVSPAKTVVPGAAGETLPSGAAVGRYMIVGDLGSGGQADVYRVIDPDLSRDLVLKLSRRQSAEGETRRDALMTEGRLLATLDHPGLVRIFDVGIHDGRPYLVLDHVPGRNFEQTFGANRPAAREAARLIAEVARVVAYAHRRGVVHGDITPRNILIDGQGRARLIDFGLSKIENAWGESAETRGGTPEFVPPEILGAGERPLSSKAAGDVFGLGATLYWLLAGQAPFAASSAAKAIDRARRCDIDFEALPRAGVPRPIARACRAALAADPNERPSADALADALERASRPWITRRVALAVVIAVLAGIGLFGLWSELHENTAPQTASIVHSIPKIMIDGGTRSISNVVPLNTGDRIAIFCNMSQGETAVMLWFNAAGELKQYSPVRDVAANIDRMVYPEPHEEATLAPPEGTDMIFFCRGGPISEDELKACFPVGRPPPPLPAQNYLELQRGDVALQGPHEKSASRSEFIPAETMMKDINRSLMKHFQSVTGIAFPHRPADETE